jgi:hypothetical protein
LGLQQTLVILKGEMLSLFKHKPQPVTEQTFKDSVQRFWQWYGEVAPRFYDTIQSKNCPSLAQEVSANVDKLLPDFAWVFGPGANGQGHSFTLSAEGNPHRQLLSLYWQAQAPKLNGWTFYAARQPGPIRGRQIEIDGQKFDPLEFWLTPTINREKEKLDLVVWHPRFETMAERERWTVLFLFLDEVLGEYGTQQWIGEMKHESKRLADSIPLEELGDFVQRVQTETGWKKLPPGESGIIYKIKEQHDRFLRGDVVIGSTMHPRLINEYLKTGGELEDPLGGTGADFVFVAFDVRILPKGNETGVRGKIEDALDAALKASASGRLLGGAWGKSNAYVDLLLFDGTRSIEIVLDVLREQNVPAGSSVNYFAKQKRGHRVLV